MTKSITVQARPFSGTLAAMLRTDEALNVSARLRLQAAARLTTFGPFPLPRRLRGADTGSRAGLRSAITIAPGAAVSSPPSIPSKMTWMVVASCNFGAAR